MNVAAPITESRAGRSGPGVGVVAATAVPTPTTFTVPLCPSTNKLFKNVGHRRARTEHYDRWRAEAITSIRLQAVPRVPGPVVINMGFEIGDNRADVDNRIKATIDVLVAAGVIDDDRHVVSPLAGKLPAGNALTHIEIWPSQKLRAEFHPSPDGARGGWVISAPQPDGEHDGLEPQ